MVALTYGDARVATPESKIATKIATGTVASPRPSFFARFLAAMMEARMRQAEREIRLYAPHVLPLKDKDSARGGW
ncbi:MAG: hypothetical protein Q8M24_10790 [Pseudolabrys sp.]|nr:hypothetical protein [Pseudolabrys sp.]MDP2295934.1 hypothetical protein [Pseudolabrys sp.]